MSGWVRLSWEERTEISRRRRGGGSVRSIADALGRAPSTISREIERNTVVRGGYNPSRAQGLAKERAKRPKVFKLETNKMLRMAVARRLRKRWSPEQIAARLRRDHPDDPRWWVSAETIYQSLFVQGRGGLNDELTRYLRSGRTARRASQTNRGHGQLTGTINISERPPEAADRAVPGHWEGDLVLGGRNSQIATLVERSSRYVMIVALPGDRTAATVRDAMIETISTLPDHLARSLTWDQGKEMARHLDFTVATGVPVFFCDPGKPWQRGTNENTNGLLRDYFPKGQTDFRSIDASELARVAHELNSRPRKTLGWDTPAEAYADAVAMTT